MDGATQDELKVREAWESVNLTEAINPENGDHEYEEIRDLIQTSLATGDISKSW
jgi:hypothetical protein